jgi:hypothetical protein
MYTLRRKGEFDAQLLGSLHCGLKKPFNRFQYEVEIGVTDCGLDDKGFVLDNMDIQAHFDNTYSKPTFFSCETMARVACEHFRELLKDREEHCIQVCVRIYGLPTAHVEYMWTAA